MNTIYSINRGRWFKNVVMMILLKISCAMLVQSSANAIESYIEANSHKIESSISLESINQNDIHADAIEAASTSRKLSDDDDPAHPLHNRVSNGQTYLYDLNVDPYENNNLYDKDASSSPYDDDLAYFKERQDYWAGLINNNPSPDETYREQTWDNLKGIGPWLTADFQPYKITQKYSYEDAPHIIFVLIDDWGYNDVGVRSNYLSWTTPTFDALASKSILLENYYTYEICSPSRAALLTGRYALRFGMTYLGPELPLQEVTLAQELKSAGYMTYMVGKWHLGTSTYQHFPTHRGFDYFYGFLSGAEDYYTKEEFEYYNKNYFDLRENLEFVTDKDEISSDLHSAYLFQSKVQNVITTHVQKYPDTPMFLYYSMQLVHHPFMAPEEYLHRCSIPTTISEGTTADEARNYCAMNIMMDEALTNLTCTLRDNKLESNLLLVISGDNGGTPYLSGNSYPFRGHKGDIYRGGVSNTAIVHGTPVPVARRGSTYSGQVHITDWLPTLMRLATNDEWTGSYIGSTIDGVDIWDAITKNKASPHEEMVFYVADDSAVIQRNMLKYVYGFPPKDVDPPQYVWDYDLDLDSSRGMCEVSKVTAKPTYEVTASPTSITGKEDNVETHQSRLRNERLSSGDIIIISIKIILLMIILYGLLFYAKRVVVTNATHNHRSINSDVKYIDRAASVEEAIPFVSSTQSQR